LILDAWANGIPTRRSGRRRSTSRVPGVKSVHSSFVIDVVNEDAPMPLGQA